MYDNLHRLTAENWMSGGTVVYAINTSYNADSEVVGQSDPDSAYAFTRDDLGRTTAVDNAGTPNVPHVVLTAGYDSANDRTSLSATINGTADFLNSYTFDADQRLTDETQQGQSGGNGVAPKQITFGYNPLGQFTSIARYDFVGVGPMVDIATAALSYDGGNRLTGLAYTGNGGSIPIDSFTFTLDGANRITARDSTVDGDVNYGYDVTNQVTSASYTGSGQPANEAYSYTKNGNRTNTGYSTGTNNQLLSDGTFNYQYDGEGNRTVRTRISPDYASDYRTTYSWDYRNRLTDVEDFDNNGVLTKHVHYVYDTLDHEIGKQVDDTGGGSYNRAEWYVLDVTPPLPSGEGRGEGAVIADQPTGSLADPLLQFDASGNLQFRYFSGPSPAGDSTVYTEEQIGTQGQAGTETWPLGDNENTPHEVVNVNSTVVDHIIANTFGVVTSESNSSVHHWSGFEGGHLDVDTAMIDDYFRWYDPATARWLSEDRKSFAAGDADLSRYAGNDPANLIDPSGLEIDGPPANYRTYAPENLTQGAWTLTQSGLMVYTNGTFTLLARAGAGRMVQGSNVATGGVAVVYIYGPKGEFMGSMLSTGQEDNPWAIIPSQQERKRKDAERGARISMKEEEGNKVSVELTAPLARFMQGAVQVEMEFKDEVSQKGRLKFEDEASAAIMFSVNANVGEVVRDKERRMMQEQAYWSRLRRTNDGWYAPLYQSLLDQKNEQDAGEEE